jgi:hypothetical protein
MGGRGSGAKRLSPEQHALRGTRDRHTLAATEPGNVIALTQPVPTAPPSSRPSPPLGLSEASQELWARLMEDYQGWSAAQLHLLAIALRAADRASVCCRAIEEDGLELHGARGGQRRPHPLLRVLMHSERLTADLFRQLGLLDR